MFKPSRCPNLACKQHRNPEPRFCTHHGTYRAKCRPRPVPRFLCRSCHRTFSRQTFRADYRDHRPDVNAALFTLITSGVGIRQSARNIGLSLRCTELKLRKMARHVRRLNLNLRKKIEGDVEFHMDEFETYEGQRNTRPLSVPLLLVTGSRFIVWSESAPIRPRGKMTRKRRNAIAKAEKRHGVRKDLSRAAVLRTLERAAQMTEGGATVTLYTDEKSTYRGLAKSAFEAERLMHHKTSSKLARTTANPLFPINHEEARARDLMGRLRRDSWLVSKMRRYLDLGLQLHICYRNLVRKRFNYDDESPAQLMGFVPRRMTPQEVLSWRQDWGGRSIYPLSPSCRSVDQWYGRAAVAA